MTEGTAKNPFLGLAGRERGLDHRKDRLHLPLLWSHPVPSGSRQSGESVAQWFLAHTDKNVSSHYIERPQKQLDVMLAYLEVDYGFEQELNRVVVRRKPSR